MSSMTLDEEKAIRSFLRLCLEDGLYGFKVDGKHFLLESEDDIEPITLAIKNATPPVIRYRVTQAQQALRRFRPVVRSSNLVPA